MCGVEELGVRDLVIIPIFVLGAGVEHPIFFFGTEATLELGESTATVGEVAILVLLECLTMGAMF